MCNAMEWAGMGWGMHVDCRAAAVGSGSLNGNRKADAERVQVGLVLHGFERTSWIRRSTLMTVIRLPRLRHGTYDIFRHGCLCYARQSEISILIVKKTKDISFPVSDCLPVASMHVSPALFCVVRRASSGCVIGSGCKQ